MAVLLDGSTLSNGSSACSASLRRKGWPQEGPRASPRPTSPLERSNYTASCSAEKRTRRHVTALVGVHSTSASGPAGVGFRGDKLRRS